MDTLSTHILVELRSCDGAALNDAALIRELLERAARAAGATVVAVAAHAFEPVGVAGVAVLEESHLSIHTWPEADYAALDVYTCGGCQPELAVPVVVAGLSARDHEVMTLSRGRHDGGPSIAVVRHRTGGS